MPIFATYDTPGAIDFIVPAGVWRLTGHQWGAGAGGRNGSVLAGRNGNGSGAYKPFTLDVVPLQHVIGYVGAPGSAGVAGEDTWVLDAAQHLAKGGQVSADDVHPGAGGQKSACLPDDGTGFDGGSGSMPNGNSGGDGGSAPSSTGAPGFGPGGIGSQSSGGSGQSPGGGGAGGGHNSNSGGVGAAGRIVFSGTPVNAAARRYYQQGMGRPAC